MFRRRASLWCSVTLLLLPFIMLFLLIPPHVQGSSQIVPLGSSGEAIRFPYVSIEFTTPITITVRADTDWQDSGIFVESGDLLRVTYLSGTWTINLRNVNSIDPYVDANGTPGKILLYTPVHNAPADGLIARIGDGNPFFVGNYYEQTVQETGILYFRVNDEDYRGSQFLGLQDNAGEVAVLIEREEVEPTPAPASLSITIDRGEGGVYRAGDTLRYAWTLTEPSSLQIRVTHSNGYSWIYYTVSTPEQSVEESLPLPLPIIARWVPGTTTITVEVLDGLGRVTNRASTWFVIEREEEIDCSLDTHHWVTKDEFNDAFSKHEKAVSAAEWGFGIRETIDIALGALSIPGKAVRFINSLGKVAAENPLTWGRFVRDIINETLFRNATTFVTFSSEDFLNRRDTLRTKMDIMQDLRSNGANWSSDGQRVCLSQEFSLNLPPWELQSFIEKYDMLDVRKIAELLQARRWRTTPQPTSTPTATDTPRPTLTPTNTPTPPGAIPTDTPPGTVLEEGQTWYQNGLALTVKDFCTVRCLPYYIRVAFTLESFLDHEILIPEILGGEVLMLFDTGETWVPRSVAASARVDSLGSQPLRPHQRIEWTWEYRSTWMARETINPEATSFEIIVTRIGHRIVDAKWLGVIPR